VFSSAVKQPPTITKQSVKHYIVDPRDNIIIECEAKGNPIPSFSWARNGKVFNVAKDPRVSMRHRAGTLEIGFRSGGKPEEYEGEYQCFARNEYGTALSSKILLRVSTMMPIVQDKRVSMGLNGDLYFSNVMAKDALTDYSCNARFQFTHTIQQKNPFSLKVITTRGVPETAPAFLSPTGTASSKTVLRGEDLLLECIASGVPTPDIKWFKRGGELPTLKTKLENFNKTLRITGVSEEDSGEYFCLANNKMGGTRHVVAVTVQDMPPRMLAPWNQLIKVIENNRTLLDCPYFGSPLPTLRW
ncbi:UNVERIFIED_CONTAM: hypothetical protein FKN15_019370, partial [Acipenser sinensis]